jgi:hypothetical protein
MAEIIHAIRSGAIRRQPPNRVRTVGAAVQSGGADDPYDRKAGERGSSRGLRNNNVFGLGRSYYYLEFARERWSGTNPAIRVRHAVRRRDIDPV